MRPIKKSVLEAILASQWMVVGICGMFLLFLDANETQNIFIIAGSVALISLIPTTLMYHKESRERMKKVWKIIRE